MVVEGAGEEGGVEGEEVGEVGGGREEGGEEAELGGEGGVGTGEEDGGAGGDNARDMGLGEAVGAEEGEDGQWHRSLGGIGNAVEGASCGEGGRQWEIAFGDEEFNGGVGGGGG